MTNYNSGIDPYTNEGGGSLHNHFPQLGLKRVFGPKNFGHRILKMCGLRYDTKIVGYEWEIR